MQLQYLFLFYYYYNPLDFYPSLTTLSFLFYLFIPVLWETAYLVPIVFDITHIAPLRQHVS
jgi:hypothetical protein